MIQVSRFEYDLLKAAYQQIKKQAAISRILEAEKNFSSGKVKRRSFQLLIKSL